MNGGSLDIASGSEIPPIFARLQNAQVRVIAVYKDDVNNQVVLVPKGSTIRSIADLKGKRVGYLRATTTHYYLLRMLEEAGLSFSDIQATSLAPRDGFAAFNAGSLDAWAIYGYNVPLAISQAGARVLKNANGYLSGNYLYYGHPAILADPQRRAASADLLVRLQRACTWFGQHQDAYAKVLSTELRVPEEAIRLARIATRARRVASPASRRRISPASSRWPIPLRVPPSSNGMSTSHRYGPTPSTPRSPAVRERAHVEPSSEHSMTQALRPDRLRAFVGRIASLVDEARARSASARSRRRRAARADRPRRLAARRLRAARSRALSAIPVARGLAAAFFSRQFRLGTGAGDAGARSHRLGFDRRAARRGNCSGLSYRRRTARWTKTARHSASTPARWMRCRRASAIFIA